MAPGTDTAQPPPPPTEMPAALSLAAPVVATRPPLLLRLAGAIRNVSPGPLLFGPVFERETWVLGRRRITYISRVVYALLLLVVVSIAFLGTFIDSADAGSGVERIQKFQQIAPIVALVIAWFQWVMLVLIAPILTGPAISDEKRNRTLAVLACTPLTAGQIVMNALSSRLMQLLILGLIATPLLLAVRLFGGLSAEQVLATTCVGLTSAILSASLGIFASVTSRRTATAVARAVGAFVGICALPFIVLVVWHLVFNNWAGRGPPGGFVYLSYFSPFFLMLGLSMPQSFSPFLGGTDVWVTHCAGSLGLSALLCLYSSVVLRRVMRQEAVSDGLAPGVKVSRRFSRRRKRTPAKPGEETTIVETVLSSSRIVGDSPVLWRELRQRAFRSTIVRWIFLVAVVACFGFAYYHGALRDGTMDSVLVVIASVLVLAFSCFSATGAVGNEMQSRTWHVLLTTPLSPRQILWGKLLGSLRRQWPVPAVLLTHLFISVVFGRGDRAVPIFGLPVICTSIVVVSSLGLLASVLFRKTTRAMVATIATVLTFLLIIPAGIAILGNILRGSIFGGIGNSLNHMAEFMITPNPVVLCTVIAQSAERFAGPNRYHLPISASLTSGQFAVFLGVVILAALVLAYGFFEVAVARFDRARNDQTGS